MSPGAFGVGKGEQLFALCPDGGKQLPAAGGRDIAFGGSEQRGTADLPRGSQYAKFRRRPECAQHTVDTMHPLRPLQ